MTMLLQTLDEGNDNSTATAWIDLDNRHTICQQGDSSVCMDLCYS